MKIKTKEGTSLARLGVHRIAIALMLVGSSVASGAWADEERPKIGLALAGGGAKGAAHVGVLKVLEELNVPIDYIAGTSMGSIVGGLYASGVSSDELAHLLATIDWEDLMRDSPSRKELSFRRKEDDSRYLLDLELGIKDRRLVWPTGLITGQKLFFMLQSMTLPVADVTDFDELPIPFRAVATDVNTGAQVILDQGNIAMALRASMAIPSVFSAVEIDGKLLVDGGLSNNVPVDVVRAMGADIVIAVDLGAPLDTREVGSFLQIYRQTMRMLTRRNMEPQLADADLVLTPQVSVFGTLEFDQIQEILSRGEAVAREHTEELSRFAISVEEHARLVASQQRPELPTSVLDFVRFEGNERVDDRAIQAQVSVGAGDALDLQRLAGDLGRLYGLGDFEQVDFRVEEDNEGRGVVIQAREKPWGPNYLHFGASLQSDLDGENEIALVANLTKTRINALGAEWRNDLRLGSDRGIFSELYQPLSFDDGWFVAPSVEFVDQRSSFFQEGRAVATLDIALSRVTVDLGYQFDEFGELRLGVERGRANVNVESGELPTEVVDSIELDDIDFGGITLEGRVDRLDNPSFPKDGSLFRLNGFMALESLGADDEYEKLELEIAHFHPVGRTTLVATLEGGWGSEDSLPIYDQFSLGGFLSLSGFAENELRGPHFGVIRLGLYRNVWRNYYLGGWLEGGNVWQQSSDIGFDDLIVAGTLLIGLDTVLGPAYLALGQAEQGDNKIYLSLGRTF